MRVATGYVETGDAYLLFISHLLADEQVENGSVLLVELLHLVDVTRNFVHRLHCDCTKDKQLTVMQLKRSATGRVATPRTVQVVVLFAVGVGERVELPQQQRVLQDPLDGFDQVRLQRGGVLLPGVPLRQEGLELWIGFGCRGEMRKSHISSQHCATPGLEGRSFRRLPLERTLGTLVWLAQKAL